MGYIALLSDLGLQDASVAIARGILMQYPHGLDMADVTHDVTPFNTRQAAYLLGSAYRNFPTGTYHVLLFDIFFEKNPSLLLSEHDGHFFLYSDNGTIPIAIAQEPANTWQCTKLKSGETFIDWLHAIGKTITGLQTNKIDRAELPAYLLKTEAPPAINADAEIIECEVIHIDQYENVVTSITRKQFDKVGRGRQFRLQFMRVEEINEVSTNYNDARTGYKLCRFNSNDYLEICINRGKAASLFGLRLGGRNNEIKLIFE